MMSRRLTTLVVLSLVVVSVHAVNAKGYFGQRISSDVAARQKQQLSKARRGLMTQSQNRRALPFHSTRSASRSKSDQKRSATRGQSGGTHHQKAVFYDDDHYTRGDDGYRSMDDYVYIPVRGKARNMGMMGMGGKAMMSKGRKRSSSVYGHDDDDHTTIDDDFYPKVKDIAFLDDQFFDDKFFEDDDCELVSFNETFSMGSASLFLAPDTSVTEPGTPALPGTLFIFEREHIFDQDGTPINGTTVSGTCTRTEMSDGGAGICNFVFVDDEGYTLNANGLLAGSYGGEIAITGGTGGMVGVLGSMDFHPIFEDDADDGDIFLDPIQYDIMAHTGLIVCPS